MYDHEILDVSRDATADEITNAYRELAASKHPDAGGNAESFREIHDAYERLLKGAAVVDLAREYVRSITVESFRRSNPIERMRSKIENDEATAIIKIDELAKKRRRVSGDGAGVIHDELDREIESTRDRVEVLRSAQRLISGVNYQ